MSNLQPVLLRELMSLALPLETRVLTSHASLDRVVTWIVIVPATASTVQAAPGDLVLLAPPYSADALKQVEQLAHTEIAGIVVIGTPATTWVNVAEQAHLPLLALPESADLREIERLALALVLDRMTAIEKRATQLYQQLAVLSAEDAGLVAMATLIGRTTAKTVLIQNKRLEIIAAWFMPEMAELRPTIETWSVATANLPESLRDRKRAAHAPEILQQLLPMNDLTRLIAPIIVKGMARGFISLVSQGSGWSVFDRRAIEQSATACALEMAKAKAVSEAEKRVRGSFVDAMLSGSLASLEAERWAKRNKYDPAGQHAAIVVAWARKEHPSYRRLETLVHGLAGSWRNNVLVQARENEVVLFCRLEAKQGIETARHIAENIHRQARLEFPNDPLAIGIGHPIGTLSGLRDSYRQARQAMTMARRFAESNPLYFGELNVYRLLFQLEHSPELASFCQETLGALVEYDRTQHTNLVETLAAYFAHNGNLSATAEALFVHRNTLLYRMERIREISGLDLDNPETRLSIQLALRAHRLLSTPDD